MKIGKYVVPDELFNEYVNWSIKSEAYLLKDPKIIDRPMSEYEISMRWSMCVQKVMEIHRQICETLEIEYSTERDDEFYSEFHKEVNKQKRLKG